MIVAGVFLILLVTILVLRKYYKRKKKRKVHPVKPEQDYVRYDSKIFSRRNFLLNFRS